MTTAIVFDELLTGTFAEQRKTGQLRFNPNHEKTTGHFATGQGGGLLSASPTGSKLTPAGRKAIRENLTAAKTTRQKIEAELESSLDDPVRLEHAKAWYPNANKYAEGLAAKHGVSTEQAVAIISAVSPRTPWPRNQTIAERILTHHKDYPSTMAAEEVAARIGGGFKANLTPAVKIARGESIHTTLTGVKRRSFYNNILHPGQTDSVTVDTWMMEAVVRTSRNKAMTKDDAINFLNADKGVITHGAGSGYVAIADAVRNVAAKHGLSPDEVQSAYWIMTTGSTTGNRPGSRARGRLPGTIPWGGERFNPNHDKTTGHFGKGHGDLGPRFGLSKKDFDSEPMHRSFTSSAMDDELLDAHAQIRASEENWGGIGSWFGTKEQAEFYSDPGIVTLAVQFRQSDVTRFTEPEDVSGFVAPHRTPALVVGISYIDEKTKKKHVLDIPDNLITLTSGIEEDEVRGAD